MLLVSPLQVRDKSKRLICKNYNLKRLRFEMSKSYKTTYNRLSARLALAQETQLKILALGILDGWAPLP